MFCSVVVKSVSSCGVYCVPCGVRMCVLKFCVFNPLAPEFSFKF
jgi:hypothetical protein